MHAIISIITHNDKEFIVHTVVKAAIPSIPIYNETVVRVGEKVIYRGGSQSNDLCQHFEVCDCLYHTGKASPNEE